MGFRRAIVAFPEAPQLVSVESIRQRFDPFARLIPAHVTLVFPFESDLPSDLLRHHVDDAVRGVEPFELSYRGARIAEDEYVFLDVAKGASELIELHDRLYTGILSAFKGGGSYAPHTTVARTTDISTLQDALSVASEAIGFTASISAVSAYRIEPRVPRRVEFEASLTG